MRVFITILIIAFVFSGRMSAHSLLENSQSNCADLEINVNINPGSKDGKFNVIVDINSNSSNFKYFFITDDRKKILTIDNFESNQINDIERGKYICIITNQYGCYMEKKFSVE